PSANFSPAAEGEVTTALSEYSPVLACAGAVTRKRADNDSSSCEKCSGMLAGVAFQPAGNPSTTTASAAPFVPFVTETKTSRSTGLAVGTTARLGVTATENAGTTFSSMRLSPVKTSLI